MDSYLEYICTGMLKDRVDQFILGSTEQIYAEKESSCVLYHIRCKLQA